jgi:hypothetical protein
MPPSPVPSPPPPSHSFSKPPITHVFHCRPKDSTTLPSSSPTLGSLDADDLQVGPWYNLRDHDTIHLEDKYGFRHVNAIVDESSTYQEASCIPEW